MDVFWLVLLKILLLVLLFAISAGLTLLTYKLIKKWKSKKVAWVVSAIIPLVVIYWISISIFPNDSFYKDEFKDITGFVLPNSAKIIYTDASYPVFHGDYCSAAIIEMESKDYNILIQKLRINKKLNDTILISSEQFDKMERKLKNKVLVSMFSKEMVDLYCFIGFYNDKKTIIIEKIQS